MHPSHWFALGLALVAAACTPRERTTELASIDQRQGYRYGTVEQVAPKKLNDTFVAMTFSGGGTRAAALAYGALKALEGTTIPLTPAQTTLADEIDIISSVSGGSVMAAMYGLKGRGGMAAFERDFLKRDVQEDLVWRALNPVTWAKLATPSYARIDVLRDYFDEKVFDGRAYEDLLKPDAGPGRRPYIVLNAADMATGSVFSFNQDQFDLLCADLSQLKLADAVSASAAFPIAFTALTLKNRAPCAAQRAAPGQPVVSGWREADGHPRPLRVINDLASQQQNLGRYRRGRVAQSYLNEDSATNYVQLLDGGIADNLGLTEPITLLTSVDRTPSIRARINRGTINKIAFVVVNARSEPDTDYGRSATPPSTLSTLLTTIGTPIDGTSFVLLDSIDQLVSDTNTPSVMKALVMVDFDFIDDATCRREFKNVATSWALSDREIDALIAVGGALVRQSENYRTLVAALRGRVAPGPTVADACRILTPPSP